MNERPPPLLFTSACSHAQHAQSQYEACSYGKVTFNPENVVVTPPLSISCNGLLNSRDLFDGSVNCGRNEQTFWFYRAETRAREVGTASEASCDGIDLFGHCCYIIYVV